MARSNLAIFQHWGQDVYNFNMSEETGFEAQKAYLHLFTRILTCRKCSLRAKSRLRIIFPRDSSSDYKNLRTNFIWRNLENVRNYY